MLLKWLFTLLAILWLYQALRDVFGLGRRSLHQAPPRPRVYRDAPPASTPPPVERRDQNHGEYVDYEEIK
jgi:hypothetical protein